MKVVLHGREIQGDVLKETKDYVLFRAKGGKVYRFNKNSSGPGRLFKQLLKD